MQKRLKEHASASALVASAAERSLLNERLLRVWDELCRAVAAIPDSRKSGLRSDKEPAGVKQLLERKQGLFRMNMMGKRVNFTCRSVISPDPNIGTHEIGVPDRFARVLTFPETITPWNAAELRQAVINGPAIHPGATMVQESSGHLIDLSRQTSHQRLAIAKRLLVQADAEAPNLAPSSKLVEVRTDVAAVSTREAGGGIDAKAAVGKSPSGDGGSGGTGSGVVLDASSRGLCGSFSCKKVWRHLRTGDALLVNRQPTLHKPGIMAHKARVLMGEKVIRMHYANCNTLLRRPRPRPAFLSNSLTLS